MPGAALPWEPPEHRICELIRMSTERFLADLDAYVDEAASVVSAGAPELAGDAALVASVRASIRADTLRWGSAQHHHPGRPVPVDVPPEAIDLARDLVRRGIDLRHLQAGYREAQNVACTRWVAAAAAMCDLQELVPVIDIGLRAIYIWVDAVLASISEQIGREQEELAGGALARRLETVTLILDGAPIPEQRASERLGYDITRRHTALVLWVEDEEGDQGALEQTARVLALAAGAPRPLIVPASATMTWAWLIAEDEPDLRTVRRAFADSHRGVRAAIGTLRGGAAGFRRSHREAVAAHQLAKRTPGGERLTAYQDVRIAVLASQDQDQAMQFVTDTLGALAKAAPELRETVRVYLEEGANAARAAERMFAHRNTVLNRVARAEELMARPLAGRHLSVGLALELLRWLGDRPYRV
jgi:DNA-binding PucR family transcriptional regulator